MGTFRTSPLGAARQQYAVARARTKPAQRWTDADQGALIVELQKRTGQLEAQLASIRVIEGPQGPKGDPGDPASTDGLDDLKTAVSETIEILKELTEQVQQNTKRLDETIETLTLLVVPRDFVPILNGEVEVAGVKHKINLIPQTIRYIPLTGDVKVFDEDGKEVDSDTYKPGEKVILDLQLFE